VKIAFQNDNVTLWHGDCREWSSPVQAVVADPPYGVDHRPHHMGEWEGSRIQGDTDGELREWVWRYSDSVPVAMFAAFPKIDQPKGYRAMLVWDKGAACGGGNLKVPWKLSFEIVWIGGTGWHGKRDPGVLRFSCVPTWITGPAHNGVGGRLHPHQKPTSLLRHICDKLPPGVTVFDPCCGSGSTLIAALETGRKAIGIEIDERWVEVARRRLERWHAQGRLDFGTANAAREPRGGTPRSAPPARSAGDR
jgi:site-specific DNA-methyltransferase (adenine-specific)